MDNLLLQENLVSLREKLEESTKHINELYGELTKLKLSGEEKDARISHLEGENEALRSQIKELVKQNKERETELSDFSEKLEQHIKEWMNLLQEKDYRISRLESEIIELTHQISYRHMRDKGETQESLHEALAKRETQIEVLKNELAAAVRDIHSCMETIEEMRSKKSIYKWNTEAPSNELLNMRKELENMNEKLQITEKKLKNAEEDARMQAQKFSEVIIQLRQYEAGEYGLSDAVQEIKELRKQKMNSEKNLQEISEMLSKYKLKCSCMEKEIASPRSTLEIAPKDTTAMAKTEDRYLDILEQQIATKQEEYIQLKMKNDQPHNTVSNLTEQIETDGHSVTTDAETKKDTEEEHKKDVFSDADLRAMFLQNKVVSILKENEALRNGMHEILESIHNQDGNSAVQIESRCLERLLEALDARHISGWYHPAMRLQAQLHAVEGNNTALREQLRIVRKEEQELREQLQKSLLQIKLLEQHLQGKQEREKYADIKEITFSSDVCTAAPQSELMKLKIQLIHVLWVHNQQVELNNNLTLKFENLTDKLEAMRLEMKVLYLIYQEREKQWQKFQNEHQMVFEALNNELMNVYTKLAHYENIWDSLSQSSDENFQSVSKKVKQMSDTMTFALESNRKYETLQNLLSEICEENLKLKVHLEDMTTLSRKSIATLKKKQEDMSLQIESLQDMLENSLPAASIEELNTAFSELKCKYKDLLLNEQNLVIPVLQ